MQILVVEDQENIASFIRKGLEEHGMSVHVVHDGDVGYELAKTKHFDAIVLDIMLPGRDGLSIVSNLRKQNNQVPVILLTARSEVNERVAGLEAGADDYLPKPFHMDELYARVIAMTRRSTPEQLNILEIGNLTIDQITREVKKSGQSIDLTSREYELLTYLIKSKNRVLTRTQICEQVWDYHHDTQTNLVDVYIRRIRQKIEDNNGPKFIHTVRGVGYKVTNPEQNPA